MSNNKTSFSLTEDWTVVVFGFDGFDQSDLDMFSSTFNLPQFTPEVVGDRPSEARGETTMDLEAAHALAPDAKKVLVNARPTVTGDAPYVRIAEMMEDTTARYPGAVWSFSIGWGCDRLFTAADLAPVRTAIATAHKHGTTVFDATGDLAGLECKGGHDWSDPPSPDDVGVDAVASIPEITAVGGTTLSTDAQGGYLAEQGWYDVPLTQGSAGGASMLFGRPSWQSTGSGGASKARRLVPDVAAVAEKVGPSTVTISNGTAWTSVGSLSAAFPANCYIGLAVASGSRLKLLPDVPTLLEIARTEEQKAALLMICGSSEFARSVFLPPGVPQERVDALRKAFDATMADKDFLAEGEQRQLPIAAVSGVEAQQVVDRLYKASPELVGKARRVIDKRAK